MSMYTSIMAILKNFGFFDIILPFILVYALMYGILAKTQIFGDPFDKENEARAKFIRSIISLISLSIAFLVVGAYNVVTKIKEFIPYAILYIITIFLLIVSISAFYLPTGKIEEKEFQKYRKVIIIVSIVLFAIITLSSFGIISAKSIQSGVGTSIFNSEIIGLIIVFGFIGAVIYWLTRSSSSSPNK